jgi:hypothetical protein
MGLHRIEINMVGGHGCDRTAGEGEPLGQPCASPTCPDCAARALVAHFKDMGAFNFPEASATMTHWPGTEGEVVDDLVTGTRKKGRF